MASSLGMKQAGYALIEKEERGLQYQLLLQIAGIFDMDIINIITYPEVFNNNIVANTTKILIELDVSNYEFIRMGLKDKMIKVFNK